MNKPLTISEKSISEILSCKTGSGVFTKTVDLAIAEKVSYGFSQVTGLYSSFVCREYVSDFRVAPPIWVRTQHPYHVTHLCKLALESKISLPDALNVKHLKAKDK